MYVKQNGNTVVNLYELVRTQIQLNHKYSKKICEKEHGGYSGDWRQASSFDSILAAADNEFYGELGDELKGHWCWFDPSKSVYNLEDNFDRVMEELADVICFITSAMLFNQDDVGFEQDYEDGYIVVIDRGNKVGKYFNMPRFRSAYANARNGYHGYKQFMVYCLNAFGVENVIGAYEAKVGKNGQRVDMGQTEGVDVKKELG